MGRIIFSVVVLVLLTILIVMNLGPTAPVNLFGAKFERVPVVAVAMLSFAVGVVYSLFLYIGQYMHRSSRERLAKRHRDIEERERKLDAVRNDQAAQPSSPGQVQHSGAQAGGQDLESSPPAESGLRRFFRMLR
jgi:uncharacterized integral membrane protein